jgi:hypothetical protein
MASNLSLTARTLGRLVMAIAVALAANAAALAEMGIPEDIPLEDFYADGTLSLQQGQRLDGDTGPVVEVAVDPHFDRRAEWAEETAPDATLAIEERPVDPGVVERVQALEARLEVRSAERAHARRRDPEPEPPEVEVLAPPRSDEGDLDLYLADEQRADGEPLEEGSR